MKISHLLLPIVFTFCQISPAQIPEMLPGWPYSTKIGNNPSFSLPHFDASSIFFNTNMGDLDKFFFDGSFYPGWPNFIDSTVFAYSPIIADLDHDGKMEMVALGMAGGNWSRCYMVVVDDNGTIMTGFPLLMPDPDILNVADFDGDNEYEILVNSRDNGLIHCLDRFGNSKPGWPIEAHQDYLVHYSFAAAIGDLDMDEKNEIIIDGSKHIYAFRYDGTMQPGFPIAISDTSFSFSDLLWSGCLVDMDNDGFLEYAVAGSNWLPWVIHPQGFVALYDHLGQMKQGWPLIFQGVVRDQITPADINNDGFPELGFESGWENSNGLQFVDVSGQTLPGWPVFGVSPTSNGNIIFADIDNDRMPEMTGDNNQLFADTTRGDSLWYYAHGLLNMLDHDGRLISGYPMRVNGSLFGHSPQFTFDSLNHKLSMGLFASISGWPANIDTAFLDIYSFPDSTGPLSDWPMLDHDNLHTRNYNFVDNVTAVQEGNEIIPKSYILRQNYPNPFNARTVISYSLPSSGNVTIVIFDILGRKVETLLDGTEKAGSHEIVWDAKGFPSGVYFARLKSERQSKSIKIVLMK